MSNVRNWAFSARPLCRPQAAGQLPAAVIAWTTAGRRDVVGSRLAACEKLSATADVTGDPLDEARKVVRP
jgi:hypothetical protein